MLDAAFRVGDYQDREMGGRMIGEWVEARGLMGLMGSGEPGKGETLGM